MRGKPPPRYSRIVVAASRPICSKNVMAASSRHLLASSATLSSGRSPPRNAPASHAGVTLERSDRVQDRSL